MCVFDKFEKSNPNSGSEGGTFSSNFSYSLQKYLIGTKSLKRTLHFIFYDIHENMMLSGGKCDELITLI